HRSPSTRSRRCGRRLSVELGRHGTAAKAVDASKLVAQSFAGWPFAREGGPVKDEDALLDPDPPTHANETLAALRHLEGPSPVRPASKGSHCATAPFTGRGRRSRTTVRWPPRSGGGCFR